MQLWLCENGHPQLQHQKMRLTRAVPAEMESVLLIFLLALQSLQQQLVQLSPNTVTAATHVKAEALKLWKLWE